MATNLIERYSRILKESIPVAMENETVSQKAEEPLGIYKDCLKNDESFDVRFSFVAPNGDLSLKDTAGVTIVLKNEVITQDLPYYDERTKSVFLGSAFTVKVQSVDEETSTVYVRSGRDNRNAIKGRLKRDILSELKSGNEPLVYGKVIMVNKVRAEVDLMGKGIRGICNVRDWSAGYVRDLRDVCHKGDILEFRVFGKIDATNKNPQRFILSRKSLSGDPWESLPKEYMVENAEIVVKCVDRPAGKSYWWGTSPLIPGIEIMGDYTQKFPNSVMNAGISYKCKVIRADVEKHRFQVVPFDVADADVNTEKAVRFYKSKEKVK